jgi:hypothetical protein
MASGSTRKISAKASADPIMRLHEEFGLSVSDDTIYRALKDLGFSHVSARPKAYKQDPEAIAAFKKTLPHALRKAAPASPRAPAKPCSFISTTSPPRSNRARTPFSSSIERSMRRSPPGFLSSSLGRGQFQH